MSELDVIAMTVDELESLRLADLEGLYHDRCSEEMNVSRQTFGRIVESARRKVAGALIEGKALVVEGGEYEMVDSRVFRCANCQHTWGLPYGAGRPETCPECASPNLHRAEEDRGQHRRGRCRGGRGVCGRQPAVGTD